MKFFDATNQNTGLPKFEINLSNIYNTESEYKYCVRTLQINRKILKAYENLLVMKLF